MNPAIEIAGSGDSVGVSKRIPVNMDICIGVRCRCTGAACSTQSSGISRNSSDAWSTTAGNQLVVSLRTSVVCRYIKGIGNQPQSVS